MGGSRNNGLRMIFFPDYFHLRINVLQIKRINPPADPALQGVFTRRNRSGPADRLPADESAGRAASRGHLEFRHGSRLQTRRASGCRRPALCRRRWPGSRSPGAGSGGGLKAGGERAEPVGGGPLRKRLREAASERNRLLAVGRWALAATSAPSQGGASGPSGPRWRCGPQAHAWSRNRPGIQGRWGRRLGRSAPIPALGVDGRRTRSCRSRSELSDEGPPEARPAIARGATAAAAGPAPCRRAVAAPRPASAVQGRGPGSPAGPPPPPRSRSGNRARLSRARPPTRGAGGPGFWFPVGQGSGPGARGPPNSGWASPPPRRSWHSESPLPCPVPSQRLGCTWLRLSPTSQAAESGGGHWPEAVAAAAANSRAAAAAAVRSPLAQAAAPGIARPGGQR